MKKFTKLISVLLLMAIILLPTSSALAKGSMDGKVIFGQNFTLEKDQTMDGDLVVFGGNVIIQEGATVKGSIVLFGGNLTQDGLVTNDVVMFGGNTSVGANGVIEGDAVTIGGQLDVADGGVIKGDRVTNIPVPEINIPKSSTTPIAPSIPSVPQVPKTPTIEVSSNPFINVLKVIFQAIAVAALAMLLALFFQPQLDRVALVVVQQPWLAAGTGFLSLVVVMVALLLMIVTIILIPVAVIAVFVVAFLFPLAWLFGIIAIGQEVGERFTKAINQTWPQVLNNGFGTFLLMLAGGFLGLVPCIGWLAPFLIGLAGIGGVVMTRFGTRLAQSPTVIAPAEPLPPAS